MFGSTDPHGFRKTVAGLCMIGAPIMFLASSVISPSVSDNTETALVRAAAGHPDRWVASTLLALAGFALFVPAVLGLMHMLRERGVAFGHGGGALALIGSFAAIANGALGLVVWQMGSGDTSEMVSLLTRIGDSAATQIPLYIVPLGVTLGALVLCWGLTANHIAPLWMTLPLGVGGVAYAVASLSYSQPLFIAASALTLIGLGAIGRTVLLETVDEWEHAPDFHGWDPLGSH